MLSRLLTRAFFTNSPKTASKLNQPTPPKTPQFINFQLLASLTFGVACFKVLFHQLRLRYLQSQIDNYEPKPAEHKGIHRISFNSLLNSELKTHSVCLYGNKSTGKTSALSSYCSNQKHCIMLKTDGKWSEELNKPGLPVKFSSFDFRLFLSAIGRLSEKHPDLVFILDGLENLSYFETRDLTKLINSGMGKSGRVIISSSDFEDLVKLNLLIEGNVLCLPEVTKEEMHQILKTKKGYRFEDVEYLWNQCEGGLEFALDMLSKGETAEKYLAEKKENIIEHIKEICEDLKMLRRLLGALLSKTDDKPLGEIHKLSKLAKCLRERGLVRHLDKDTFSFRNKFVFATILEFVSSQKS